MKEKEIKKWKKQHDKMTKARQKKWAFLLDAILIVVCFLVFLTAAIFQIIGTKLHKKV